MDEVARAINIDGNSHAETHARAAALQELEPV